MVVTIHRVLYLLLLKLYVKPSKKSALRKDLKARDDREKTLLGGVHEFPKDLQARLDQEKARFHEIQDNLAGDAREDEKTDGKNEL